MALNSIEQAYLAGQRHGRLATVAPDGSPQNKPVGFRYNADLGTIDIYGFQMETSAKFRNIQANLAVAFVVDDVIAAGPAGTRFLEIRGRAEAVSDPVPSADHLSPHVIRTRLRRVIGWNIDPDRPGLHARDISAHGSAAAT